VQIGFSEQQEKLQELLSQILVEAGLRQVDPAERFGEPQSFVGKLSSESGGWTYRRFARFVRLWG